jgi:hypothetical protein
MSTFIGILQLIVLLLLVAAPVVFIWGFYRAVIFTGAEMVANMAEKTQGASFADKQKKWGYYLMLIGLVLGAISVGAFYFGFMSS